MLRPDVNRSGFITPSDAPGAALQASRKCSQPIEVAPLSESACALLAGVIQGYETTSNPELSDSDFGFYGRPHRDSMHIDRIAQFR